MNHQLSEELYEQICRDIKCMMVQGYDPYQMYEKDVADDLMCAIETVVDEVLFEKDTPQAQELLSLYDHLVKRYPSKKIKKDQPSDKEKVSLVIYHYFEDEFSHEEVIDMRGYTIENDANGLAVVFDEDACEYIPIEEHCELCGSPLCDGECEDENSDEIEDAKIKLIQTAIDSF